MEYQVLDDKTTRDSSLSLDSDGIQELKKGRGWALFLAILGFIGIGFMAFAGLIVIVVGIFTGSQSGMPMGLVGLAYLIFAGLFLFPQIYLAKFSGSTMKAISRNDSSELNNSIKNIALYFKSRGIIVIVVVAFYILLVIGMLIFGATSALGGDFLFNR